MTKDGKKTTKRSESKGKKEPRVKKETLKDLDAKGESRDVKGGAKGSAYCGL